MADPIMQNSTGFFQSLYDGILKGDFSSNNTNTKTASQIGIGLIPVIGQVADTRDTIAALNQVHRGKSGAWSNLAFSLIGWIPAAGDFVKSANKIGIKETFNSVGDVFSSAKNTWKEISIFDEAREGKFNSLFYQPATNMKAKDLPPGVYGVTNRWGDIQVRKGLDSASRQSTYDHENVHRFFSPKFKYGQEFRSKLGLLGYIESHLLRRTEEGLAEAWARFKAEGFSAIAKGWRFPYENPYDIDPIRVKIERNVLLGLSSSAIGAGASLEESIKNNE